MNMASALLLTLAGLALAAVALTLWGRQRWAAATQALQRSLDAGCSGGESFALRVLGQERGWQDGSHIWRTTEVSGTQHVTVPNQKPRNVGAPLGGVHGSDECAFHARLIHGCDGGISGAAFGGHALA